MQSLPAKQRNDEEDITMALTRSQRGFLTFSGVLLILVVGAIFFVAFKLLPPYIRNYQLQDSLETIARTATYNRMTETQIRDEVLSEAEDLGILLEKRQVAVRSTGNSVDIAVRYVISVDLLVRQLELQFAPGAGNRNIMAR